MIDKKIGKKLERILAEATPIILMLILIAYIKNDYLLTGIFVVIIAISFLIKYEKKDSLFLVFGFIIMIICEYFFIKTGAEIFSRNSLFGIMPLWLPFLWAYAFVAIKRVVKILK